MKIRTRARRTKVILEEGDLAKIIEDGKLSGGYKGHNYLVTSPPSPVLGVSEDIHNTMADQLVESKKEVEDLKATIDENMIVNRDNLDHIKELEEQKFTIGTTSDELLIETAELKARIKRYKKKIKKYTKTVEDLERSTIPIKEHEDLIGAKVKAFDHATEIIEEESKQVINKLEDEADEMTAEIRDLKGGLENAQTDLNECTDKKEEYFNKLGDCEELITEDS